MNIDDTLLAAARQALGTSGVTETVNRALACAARGARLRDFDVREFDVTDEDIAAGRVDSLA